MTILTLDKHYEPHQWITIEEAMILEAKELVLEHLGEAIFIYRGGTNRMGVDSKLETNSIIVVDGVAPFRKHRDPSLTNSSLFQRDRCICAYCGNRFKSFELTRDHVMPQSKGGPDHWMNVVTACKRCNSLKDDVMPGHKLPNRLYGPQGDGYMNPLYVPYVPCRAEHMILKNRNIKLDQMEFLLQRVSNKKSRIFDYAKDYLEVNV
jgi:hypothetical protein